jgi:hypothetical protein
LSILLRSSEWAAAVVVVALLVQHDRALNTPLAAAVGVQRVGAISKTCMWEMLAASASALVRLALGAAQVSGSIAMARLSQLRLEQRRLEAIRHLAHTSRCQGEALALLELMEATAHLFLVALAAPLEAPSPQANTAQSHSWLERVDAAAQLSEAHQQQSALGRLVRLVARACIHHCHTPQG